MPGNVVLMQMLTTLKETNSFCWNYFHVAHRIHDEPLNCQRFLFLFHIIRFSSSEYHINYLYNIEARMSEQFLMRQKVSTAGCFL